jgi:hypothetical protein
MVVSTGSAEIEFEDEAVLSYIARSARRGLQTKLIISIHLRPIRRPKRHLIILWTKRAFPAPAN